MDMHERIQGGAFERFGPEDWEEAEAHAADCEECAAVLPRTGEEVVEPPPPRRRPRRWRTSEAGGGLPPRVLHTITVLALLGLFLFLGAVFQSRHGMAAAEPAGAPEPEAIAPVLVSRKPRMAPLSLPERFKEFDGESMPMAKSFSGAGVAMKELGDLSIPAPAPDPKAAEAPPALRFQEGRKLIRNADVEIEVAAYDVLHAELGKRMSAIGGYLSGESKRRLANGKTEALLTLRVPPAHFEAILRDLAGLGTIRHQTLKTEDVTKAYVDLESRLRAKELLAERLRGILKEAKGEVKDLVDAEAKLGAALEQIEQLKGEIRYYDNLTGFSTIVLRIAEKDLALPFEYVQTFAGHMELLARDPEDAFARAQKAVADAGGRVVEARVSGQAEGQTKAFLRARVEAEKYPALREALRKIGHPTADRIERQKTPRGGSDEAAVAEAPLRQALATLDLSIESLAASVTRRAALRIETGDVDAAYQAARRAAEAAAGRVLDGSLTGSTSDARATLRVRVDAERFAGLFDALKAGGTVRQATVEHVLPDGGGGRAVREEAELALQLSTPEPLVPEDRGIGKAFRDTVAGSWSGILWSVERMVVGAALSAPWILLGLVGWLVWRRRKSAATGAATP